MASQALKKRLEAQVKLLRSRSRYLNVRMEFVTHEGVRLLSVGGLWDQLRKGWAQQGLVRSGQGSLDSSTAATEMWTPQDGWARQSVIREHDLAQVPEGALCPAHVITVEESQVEVVRAFSEWLYAFVNDLPRPTALDVLAGNRRGGKTFIMVACILAAALACPLHRTREGKHLPFVGWLVVPAYPEQREIHEDLRSVLSVSDQGAKTALAVPESWYVYRPKDNVYRFLTGAEIYLKTAHLADSLKQGRVDIIGINEAQKVDGDAVVHAAGNNIDRGGLTLLAANPPQKLKGAYLLEIKDAWEEGKLVDSEDGQKVVRWFFIDPRLNRQISQAGRRKHKMLAGVINPRLAAADAEGEWNRINDLAMHQWRRECMIETVPAHWENCTGEVISEMRLREYLRPPGSYTSFGGMDFNKYPWFAAVGLHAYRVPERGGALVYVIDRECRNDPDGERGRTEREFAIQLYVDGWDPEELLFIADPSGQWQSSEHRKRGGVSAGFSSYDLFKTPTVAEVDGRELTIPAWDMFAPTTWKLKDSKHYAHPRKTESLDEVNELLRTKRLFVLASCTHVVSAMKKCPLDPHAPGADKDFWHVIDAIRYPIHRAQGAMEPKKRVFRGAGGVRAGKGAPVKSVGFGGGGKRGAGMFSGGGK